MSEHYNIMDWTYEQHIEEISYVIHALRAFWSLTNKNDFLGIFFPDVFHTRDGWLSPRDEWYDPDPGEYYHNMWVVFQNQPLLFWCEVDSGKRHTLYEQIARYISYAREAKAESHAHHTQGGCED